jgi:anti-sigma regulatory factor (Ser/Thr protein kinase)
LEFSVVPTPSAPGLARAAVSDWLGRERDDEPLTENALLLVSELVTNCLRHAVLATEEPLRLSGSLSAATLRLELWDSGTVGTVAPRTRERDDDFGGYGLELVALLSSAWGVERDGQGTTVWLHLPIDPPASA